MNRSQLVMVLTKFNEAHAIITSAGTDVGKYDNVELLMLDQLDDAIETCLRLMQYGAIPNVT